MKTRHFDRIGNGGISFTELGFGTAPLGNLYRAVSDEDANATLEAAWQAGCRYLDTAPLYGLGLSETRLNPFLRWKRRDDFALSTKVGRIMRVCPPDQHTGVGKWFNTPSRREVYDYSYDGAMRSFEASLERLGVNRVDILFVHDLDIFTHGSKEAAERRVEEFMRSGATTRCCRCATNASSHQWTEARRVLQLFGGTARKGGVWSFYYNGLTHSLPQASCFWQSPRKPPGYRHESGGMAVRSAGLLIYRRSEGLLQVLLVHPGGPFWAKKDDGAWSIPKGLVNESEDEWSAA
jgi:aryl-alcohol dehydrogenase-like predicted oxidoreductase